MEYILRFDGCQCKKYQAMFPVGLLQPLPISELVWDNISIDFITGFPLSQGYDVILVVVNHLSKYAHFISLKHPYLARTMAESFIRDVAKLHHLPKFIISDRDPLFLSKLWSELFFFARHCVAHEHYLPSLNRQSNGGSQPFS